VNVRGYLEVLRRRWRSAAIAVLLCLGGSVALSAAATPVYESSASLFFSLQNGDSANDLAQGSTFTQNQMASYATLVTTAAVLQPVIDDLGIDMPLSELARHVSVTTPDQTVVLKISVSSGSPTQAAFIANSVAEHLTDVVDGLAPVNEMGLPNVRSTVVAPAEPPRFPASPNTRLNAVVGLLLGLVIGGLVVVLHETLDSRVGSVERVRGLTDLPILGALAVSSAEADGSLVLSDEPLSPQAELYRQLRTNLEFCQLDGRSLTVGVTSAISGEGKSTVSLNLALALAEVTDRVLLVDADLRRPTIADRLGIEGAAGLSTVLAGRARFDDVVQEWGPRRLAVLTAGQIPPNPTELLSSPAMRALVAGLADRYDAVVFDSAPLLPVSDALLLSRFTTGMVVVANSRKVRRGQLSQALSALAQVQVRVLGIVVTMVAARGLATRYGYRAEEMDVGSSWWARGRRRSAPPVPAPPVPAARTLATAPAAGESRGTVGPRPGNIGAVSQPARAADAHRRP
jgi:succinoglycan biosynthesis transport protein ExoP